MIRLGFRPFQAPEGKASAQHFLNFLPLPHGHGSLRPILGPATTGSGGRLYRTVKSCARAGQPHRKKTELARELLDVFGGWIGARRVEVAADSAYCNYTITRGLPDNFVLFGAMRPDAVLTAPPAVRPRKPGRPSRRGRPVAKPEAIAKDRRRPWLSCEATLYG